MTWRAMSRSPCPQSSALANAGTCDNCWCFVCDVKAEECAKWRGLAHSFPHCSLIAIHVAPKLAY